MKTKEKKVSGYQTCLLAALLFFFLGTQAFGASTSFGEAEAAFDNAEKAFETGKKDFEAPEDRTGKSDVSAGQRSGKTSFSKAQEARQKAEKPETAREARDQALQGSPETGYAGTWTDPATGDIITSVIAPQPQVQSGSSNYPIYVSPDVSDWYSGGNSSWNGYPNWPVTPDNPGYGGPWQPSQPPSYVPPPPVTGGGNFYPYPQPPQNFQPGYRPLRPGMPGGNAGMYPPPSGQPGMNPGQAPLPGIPPSWTGQPGYNPGQYPPAQGQPGMNPGQAPLPGIPPSWTNPTPSTPSNPGAGTQNPAGSFPGWQPGSSLPNSGAWSGVGTGNSWNSSGHWGANVNWRNASGQSFRPSAQRGGSLWHPGMDRPGGFNPSRPWRPSGR